MSAMSWSMARTCSATGSILRLGWKSLAEPGAICVSAAARDHIGNKLPLGFDDLGEQQVKNIAQPIRVYRMQTGTPVTLPAASLPLPEKPSIAVLPFQNMSGDPEQEYFADGMAEEIITALSRIRWLFVIARNSSFTYKGQSVDVKRVGRELGVHYALEGSVRKGGERVRITAQLVVAETGTNLWADRFDGPLEDVFDLQDEIALSVAGVIEPALQVAEMRRSAARPTDPPHCLRPVSACPLGILPHNERSGDRGPGIVRAGDRDRSALWASTLLGSNLPSTARQ